MRNFLKILLFSLLCILTVSVTALAADDTKVCVNGEYIEMDQKPIFKEDRILIPVRAVGEALKCKVDWDHDTQTAILNSGATELKITIGESKMNKINISRIPIDIPIELEVPAFIENGRTILPLRAVSEALFLDVNWNEEERTVVINNKYDFIGIETAGYIRVDIGDKMGFMDIDGNIVIPIEYENDGAYGYVQGNGTYAIVKKDGKFGAVDMKNKPLVNFSYTLENIDALRTKAETALRRKGTQIPEEDLYGRDWR